MKKIALKSLSIFVSIGGICIMNMIPVAAATRYAMVQKTIAIGGQTISKPLGFATNGTSYMPIYYIMQSLDKLGVQNQWNGSVWNLVASKTVRVGNPSGSGKNSIEANGKTVYRVNGIVTIDPSSKKNTTYMPIWYIMQVLTDAGMQSAWNGTNWAISGAASGSGSTNVTPGQLAKLPNVAVDDSSFWSRAGNRLYTLASTDNNFSNAATKPILNLEPDETIYLMAYSGSSDIQAKPIWYVNSKDATIVNDASGDWTYGSHEAKSASFTASKPGVYTVQYSIDGKYSVPIVLIVGMSSLSGARIPVSNSSSGVLPLPSGLQNVLPETIDNITYYPYRPISGWLPVTGRVTGSASSVVVDLESTAGNEWTYVLPVQNGVFKGMVRVPFQGNVQVSLVTDFWNTLNQSNGSWSTNVTYYEDVTTPAPSELEKSLLASAMMDWNMSSQFNVTASVLADNSPSKNAAIAAISNYVSEKVVYDFADYNANKFVWKSSTDVLENPIGVCEDISELTASMLKSIGIPAEALVGAAPVGSTPDDHEWLRAYNGTSWIVIDPTWNGSGGSINSSLSNEYMTDTESLSSNHVLDNKQSYSWQ